MERRHFLMGAAVAATALKSKAQSPNDTIRVGVAGLRSRGSDHLRAFRNLKGVEVAAVCDIDENVMNERVREIFSADNVKQPAKHTSFRKMLEDQSLDAISIATCNHSHTLQAVWAMQAGKHVYVEKPCSHNVFESQQIVAAARKYDRIVQMGSQSRSSPALQEAVRKMKEGLIGEVYYGRGLCYKWRDTIGKAKEEAVPEGVHYDEWIGPAPVKPFTQNRFHYNWHWQWDYGNGDFGNQGIHELDIARWGLGVSYPTKVSSMGAHFMFDDDQETPNTMVVNYEFVRPNGKPVLMVFETRHWLTNGEGGVGGLVPVRRRGGRQGQQAPEMQQNNTIGNLYYGSEGYLVIDNYNKYYSFLGKNWEKGPEATSSGDHYANFFDAIRANKREMLNAEIAEGAISCTLMHLGNIACRLGRTLEFDARTMTIKGDSEANRMFTRNYRKPYVVPEKV